MIIQPVLIISTWTNDIQKFFPVDTESLDPHKKYTMVAGELEPKADPVSPGEELLYSEEFDYDSWREEGCGKEICINDEDMTFFKTKIEKAFSFEHLHHKKPYIYNDYLVCDINSNKLKKLVLCRIISDAK